MKPKTITTLAILLLGGGAVAWWQLGDHSSRNTSGSVETPQNDPASPWVSNSTTTPGAAGRAKALSNNPALLKLTDSSQTWQSRVALCDKLLDPETLTEADIESLFTALREYRPEDTRNHRESWFVVANEIMEVMRERGIGADRYTAELSAILHDPAQHFVMRDYAVQHLSMWLYPATPDSPGEADPTLRATGLQNLIDLPGDTTISHTSIPGTALMALADLTDRAPQEVTDPLWQQLAPVVRSYFDEGSSASLPNKVSALQAVSRSQVAELHPLIRRLANDARANPSVRLSSVAALGNYGDPADKPLLQQIANAEPRLRHAAAAALQRITTN